MSSVSFAPDPAGHAEAEREFLDRRKAIISKPIDPMKAGEQHRELMRLAIEYPVGLFFRNARIIRDAAVATDTDISQVQSHLNQARDRFIEEAFHSKLPPPWSVHRPGRGAITTPNPNIDVFRGWVL